MKHIGWILFWLFVGIAVVAIGVGVADEIRIMNACIDAGGVYDDGKCFKSDQFIEIK